MSRTISVPERRLALPPENPDPAPSEPGQYQLPATAALKPFAQDNSEANEELATTLRSLVSQHLGLRDNRIGQYLPMNRLGLDRLGLMHLAAAIDLELGVYAPCEILAEGMTVAKLTELIARERSQPAPVPPRVVERFSADCLMLSA